MFIVKQYEPEMKLFTHLGDKRVYYFSNYIELLYSLSYDVAHEIGNDKNALRPKEPKDSGIWRWTNYVDFYGNWHRGWEWFADRHYHYWVEDEFGNPMSANKIKEDYGKTRRRYKTKYEEEHCVFRCDPVPWCGKSRYCNFLRYPKTTQEKKQYDSYEFDRKEIKDEYALTIKVRGRRSRMSLPTAYDDIPRHNEKNWKKFRKKQYKASSR